MSATSSCAGGARPELGIAERSGLLVENGGVRVDSSLRASAPHTYAVGDIAFADHAAAGRPLRVEHWGDAEQHGTIAGTVAGGGSAPLAGATRLLVDHRDPDPEVLGLG